MTAEMAVGVARQIYMLLHGFEVSEELFVRAVAPEIYSAARMENLATQQTLRSWCGELEEWCDEGIAKLSSRYVVPSPSASQPATQPEQLQTEETRVVLATEEDIKELLEK